MGSLEKSLASLGGFVIVPRDARDFFRYNSYTYIFSGQIPPPYLASALAAFDILETEGPGLHQRLESLINHVRSELRAMGFELIGEDRPFPLILVKVGDVYCAPKASRSFLTKGFMSWPSAFP